MSEDRTVRVFTASGCESCHEVTEAIQAQDYTVDADVENIRVQVHDLTSEEDYHYLEEYDLTEVPSAYLGGQKCEIGFDDDRHLMVLCRAASPNESEPPTSKPDEPYDVPEDSLETPLDDLSPE